MLHKSLISRKNQISLAENGAYKIFDPLQYDEDDHIEEISAKMHYFHKQAKDFCCAC